MSRPLVEIIRLGIIPYREAQQIQVNLAKKLISQCSNPDIQPINKLILLEHPPIYTIGIRSKNYSLEVEEDLKRRGADFYRADRGGLITFHGPGQLVAYPIISLKNFRFSVKEYVRRLENCLIEACRRFSLQGSTNEHVGVWINDKKVAAIGIRATQFVTLHGVALNCNTELAWFDHIQPCGIHGRQSTSLSQQLHSEVTVASATPHFLEAFRQSFDCQFVS